MRLLLPAGYLTCAALAAAVLTGCGSGSQSLSPTADRGPAASSFALESVYAQGIQRRLPGPSSFSPDVDAAGSAAVYVSDFNSGTVTVFSTAGKQTAQVTGFSFPKGLTGDTSGNVYVVDQGVSTLYKYSAGLKMRELTIPVPGYFPTDVSVSGAGVVGVTSGSSLSSGNGSAMFFAKGSTTPCATVTDPNWWRIFFGAFDDKGNLYIDGRDPSGNVLIGVVTGGCSAKKITTLTGAAIGYPGGIQVAPNDNVLIDDQTVATIYTYKPPVNHAFGAPVASTVLSGASDSVFISLNATAKDIYDTDAGNLVVQEFAYPAGGSALKTFIPSGVQSVGGVYVSPVEQP